MMSSLWSLSWSSWWWLFAILGSCQGFVLPLTSLSSSSTSTASISSSSTVSSSSSSSALFAVSTGTGTGTRSSPYAPVDVSGPRWNGQRWENQPATHYEQFARNRAGLRNRPTSSTSGSIQNPTINDDTAFTDNFVPPAPAAPPLVRYSTLPEEAKADIADPTGRSRNRVGPYYYSPPPPSVAMPEFAQEIQGGSRGTWTSAHSYDHDQVQVTMATDGRPLSAEVEVYQGPDNTPQRMRIYSEDGRLRPFTTMIQTPAGAAANANTALALLGRASLRNTLSSTAMTTTSLMGMGGRGSSTTNAGASHSISIRNTGPIEFPLVAGVEGKGQTPDEERAAAMTDYAGRSMGSFLNRREEIHGGHLRTYPFDPSVASVEVKIHSQGLPIMAVVELWQGPGDVKTIAQVYCDDGQAKPFSAIIETPGNGNTIAIRNVGPQPYVVEAELHVYSVDNTAYSYGYGEGY